MKITLLLILIAAIAYFLGGINGAIITSRYIYRRDVRASGSGNAGLTNFYRVFGAKGLAMVAVIDVGKGLLAALIGGWLLSLAGDYAEIGRSFAVFCLVLGHDFPVYYGFRGGKGILCGVAGAFIVDWRAGMICLLIFAIAVGTTRLVSLGSVLGTISYPVTLLSVGYTGLTVWLAFFAILLILIKHSGNIVRLIQGTEPRVDLRRNVTHKLDEEEFR